MPSRERGGEPRPRAPVPTPAKHACRTAPRGSGRPHPKAARGAGDKVTSGYNFINELGWFFHPIYELFAANLAEHKIIPM